LPTSSLNFSFNFVLKKKNRLPSQQKAKKIILCKNADDIRRNDGTVEARVRYSGDLPPGNIGAYFWLADAPTDSYLLMSGLPG